MTSLDSNTWIKYRTEETEEIYCTLFFESKISEIKSTVQSESGGKYIFPSATNIRRARFLSEPSLPVRRDSQLLWPSNAKLLKLGTKY